MALNSFFSRCHLFSSRSRLLLNLIVIFTLIIILYLSYSSSLLKSGKEVPKFIKYRLRNQDNTAFNFVQFRDPPKLITLCESIATIDCLAYLNQNQSDYLQPLSTDDMKIFKDNYCMKTKKMLYHTYWSKNRHLDHPFVHLFIRSFLYTQNLECSHLIIWTVPPLDPQIHRLNMLYAPHVEFRSLIDVAGDLFEVGTPIGPFWYKSLFRWLSTGRAQIGDAVRFILLNKYGGLYIDVDTLLLRDLQPFFLIEFAYRWSILDGFNTAVLRLFPGSNTTSIVINRGRQDKTPYAFYPTTIHTYSLPTNFYRFPSALFDPIWLPIDGGDPSTQKAWKFERGDLNGFKNPFLENSEISRRGRAVFTGAFAFHWHSSSATTTFERGSYMQQWDEFLNAQIFDQSDASKKSL